MKQCEDTSSDDTYDFFKNLDLEDVHSYQFKNDKTLEALRMAAQTLLDEENKHKNISTQTNECRLKQRKREETMPRVYFKIFGWLKLYCVHS